MRAPSHRIHHPLGFGVQPSLSVFPLILDLTPFLRNLQRKDQNAGALPCPLLTEAGMRLFHLICPDLGHPSWAGAGFGVPDSLNLHVGLAELKAALGGGWATLGDIIMYKKSFFWSLQGGAVSSSASRVVLGPAGTPGLAWPLWGCPLVASTGAGACSSSMAWFPSWITLSPPAGGGRAPRVPDGAI